MMSARRSRGHPIRKATSRPVSAAATQAGGERATGLLTSRCEFINGRQKKGGRDFPLLSDA